jgi:hypothetical protein
MPSAVAILKHGIKDRANLKHRVRLAIEEIAIDEFGGSNLQFKEGKNAVSFNFSMAGLRLSGEVLLTENRVEAKIRLPLIGVSMQGMVIETLYKLIPKYLSE